MSLPRLRRLAACYGVPINQLLPEEDTYEIARSLATGVTIDLNKVDDMDDSVATDVAMLAMLLDIEDAELLAQLESKTTLD